MRLSHRDVFFAARGFGSHRCFFCGRRVAQSDLVIHHEDENRDNNSPENLHAAHDACHKSHHSRKLMGPLNVEHREKIRQGLLARGGCQPGCECRRHGPAWNRGRPHPMSDETRQKIGRALRGRPKSPKHRAKLGRRCLVGCDCGRHSRRGGD